MGKLVLALLAIAGASAAAAPSPSVEIETWTTAATPARPEVHVLLRNRGDEPVVFVLELGDLRRGAKVRCAGNYAERPDSLTRFHFWNGVSFGDSTGLIPSNGWTHRSFILGEYGKRPPCTVPYRLKTTSEGSTVEGVIDVPIAAPPVRETVPAEDVEWAFMVEKHRVYEKRLVARLAIQNKSEHAIVVGLDRRSLDCDGAARASWSSHHGAIQGQDVGPIQIPGHGRGVFVAAIDYWGTENPGACSASADLQLSTVRGRTILTRVEFRLRPTGFLDATR